MQHDGSGLFLAYATRQALWPMSMSQVHNRSGRDRPHLTIIYSRSTEPRPTYWAHLGPAWGLSRPAWGLPGACMGLSGALLGPIRCLSGPTSALPWAYRTRLLSPASIQHGDRLYQKDLTAAHARHRATGGRNHKRPSAHSSSFSRRTEDINHGATCLWIRLCA